MKKLIKENPNDQDLGRAVRKLYLERGDEAAELLKEVLALHGFGGKDTAISQVDDKIVAFLEKIGEVGRGH